MKFSNHAATLAIFLLAVGFAIGLTGQYADAASGTFSVTLNLSNVAPTITYVDNTLNFTPVADSTTAFYMYFNASDANGAADLVTATATIVIAFGDENATSSSCSVQGTNGNEREYNCSVSIPYYFNMSDAWTINASIEDQAGLYVENTTETFAISYVLGMSLVQSSISFDGSPGDNDVGANEGAQEVRNTGNYDFTQLNLTGFDLNSTADFIGAGNFSVNVTNSALGQALLNNSPITVVDSDMSHGLNNNETLYLYLDIPSGIDPDVYQSSSNFVVDVN